jgi:hypothetical protein
LGHPQFGSIENGDPRAARRAFDVLAPAPSDSRFVPLPPGTLSPDAFAGAFIETTSTWIDPDRWSHLHSAGPRERSAHLTGWVNTTSPAMPSAGLEAAVLYGGGFLSVTLVLILYQTRPGVEFAASVIVPDPYLPASPTLFEGRPGSSSLHLHAHRHPQRHARPDPTATDTPLPPTKHLNHRPTPLLRRTPDHRPTRRSHSGHPEPPAGHQSATDPPLDTPAA